MNIQLYFGMAIKQLRISQKISQEKFALHINMDRTYYASVENGHRNISNLKYLSVAKPTVYSIIKN